MYEFKFPDVGEGITEGEIVRWLVKEGQNVRENEIIVQIETDKAVVDIPSPRTGKIIKINFKSGDTIKVGQPLVIIDDGSEGKLSTQTEKKKSVSVVGELEEAEDEPVIKVNKPDLTKSISKSEKYVKVLAVPRVRELAKKLNVDITKIKGTGEDGSITEDDVIAVSKGVRKEISLEENVSNIKIAKKYDMWGYVDRVPLKGVRKTIAMNMMSSFHNVAPVTSMIDIDVTELWNLREKEKVKAEMEGVKLTFFPYIIRAIIEGLKKHPYLNSEINGDEIIIKKYYNIGIAVDTEYGLVVPVIKRAEIKNLYEIAKEIVELAEKAKERKLDLMDMKGGSFTITNYGSIGGNYGTPIINTPEAVILGLGRIFDKVVLNVNKVENRKILPLSLTFDHRILDGAEAARFLNDIKDYLENPEKIKFEGDKE